LDLKTSSVGVTYMTKCGHMTSSGHDWSLRSIERYAKLSRFMTILGLFNGEQNELEPKESVEHE